MSFISTYDIKFIYKIVISVVVGLLYAISDEIHQSFIPGRLASVIDVGIDTTGVIMGIFIVPIIISIHKKLNKKISKYNNK